MIILVNKSRRIPKRGRSPATQIWPVAVSAGIISLSPARANAAEPEVCQKVLTRTAETVIAFEPPSTFTICRDGREETDVVTGRPIYVEVLADERTLFRYSIHGLSKRPQRTGLTRLARRSRELAQTLHNLAASGDAIDETGASMLAPSDEAPAKSRDRRIIAPRFHDVIGAIETDSLNLSRAATELNTWCAEVTKKPILPVALDQAVRDRCAGIRAAEVSRSSAKLLETIGAFRAAEVEARAALISSSKRPSEHQITESEAASAIIELVRIRDLASSLQRQARELAPVAEQIAEASGLVHEAISGGGGALRIATPVHLGTLEHSGFAVLQIDASPVVLSRAAEDWEETEQETIGQRFRFAVVSPHYVDVEAGIGLVTGLPGVPAYTNRGGTTVLTSSSIDQFVGLALAELEPLRFLYPDRPLAGLLRFPVIGVPLNRDPTQNYFVGTGLGWTGIGSITSGPSIVRQASFAHGYAEGQTLPSGVSLASTTTPAFKVGYFVSASIDLLGLLHLFIPVHEPTYDVVTGTDVAPYPTH